MHPLRDITVHRNGLRRVPCHGSAAVRAALEGDTMSQPPPWDQGQPSPQGQPDRNQPDQDQPPPWPAIDQPPSRPSGDQPPAWPSAGQAPSWPSGGQPPADQPSGGQPPGGQLPGGQPPAWPSVGAGQGQPPSWPTPGQSSPPPPSWPAGGVNQPPPSSWLPPGQPPYPGPGYSYGYGPRPPRRIRRPRFLSAIITLGVIIVLGVVVGNVSRSHESVSVSVTPFPSGASASAGHQEPPGKVGSSFELKDGSGNVYRVTLAEVIDPANGENQFSVPGVGKRFVGLVFRVKALTGSPKDEDANNDAVVIGGNGQNYSADFDGIAGYTNFAHGVIHVSPGETVKGSVTFQLPKGVTVSKVQWTALSGFGSTVVWIVHG